MYKTVSNAGWPSFVSVFPIIHCSTLSDGRLCTQMFQAVAHNGKLYELTRCTRIVQGTLIQQLCSVALGCHRWGQVDNNHLQHGITSWQPLPHDGLYRGKRISAYQMPENLLLICTIFSQFETLSISILALIQLLHPPLITPMIKLAYCLPCYRGIPYQQIWTLVIKSGFFSNDQPPGLQFLQTPHLGTWL